MHTIQLDSSRYQAPDSSHWTGRISPNKPEPQYWHQAIQTVDLKKGLPVLPRPDIVFLGYACDEGVRRNLGRVGACEGPKLIRSKLGKLAYHQHSKNVMDLGDITCPDNDMEASQDTLADVISQLVRQQVFPILMGGGHDIAYGHFKGLWEATQATSSLKIGIINLDAHFDLRPIESKANSGTPFLQILENCPRDVEYFAIGIQSASNAPELFEIARKHQVQYLLSHECAEGLIAETFQKLAPFVQRNDYIYLSIDLDGFSSAYAPGVSAPSPLGFSPSFALMLIQYLFQSGKVVSCDLAELNPALDIDQSTANLAARLIDYIVSQL